MTALAFDSSALLTWLLQERGWRAIDEILHSGAFQMVMPAPVLTECIYRARSKGNVSSGGQIAAALEAQGLVVEAPQREDLVVAADLHEVSRRHPFHDSATQKAHSLSLADCLVLAVCQRLDCRIVSRDRYWAWLADHGHVDAKVVVF
jgi:predicted nucleic acid-binding protein